MSALTDSERRALACVLDEIVPPSADGCLPGAGEAGVVAYIEAQTLRQSPELLPSIRQGLAAADALAREKGAASLADLAPETRREVLRELEASSPLVASLTIATYLGYYQQPRVVEALGLGAEPPHPGGYEMEPNDLRLLDAVRRRGRLYRQC
jgi:hypothetical protein